MTSLGKTVGKRAARATVRHSWRGAAAKAKRKPLRNATVFTIGGAVGLVTGWLAARKTAPSSQGS